MKARGWRIVSVAAAIGLLIPLTLVVGPAPAAPAESCGPSDGCHVYSQAEAFYNATGIEGQWHDNLMYESAADYSTGGHINQEMWISTTNGGYVEEGLLNGKQANGNPCNCLAYQQFWAETTDQGAQVQHWLANLSLDGAQMETASDQG